MCGIAGMIRGDAAPIETGLLFGMNDAMHYRGPDDEGYVLIRQADGACAQYSGAASPDPVKERLPRMPRENPVRANVGLAHRRFSIIDLSPAGHQPFFDSAGTVCVIFNGEIYNYVELRDELKGKGHVFLTESDTEAVVEAYKAWGTGCFSRFAGMWALAIYDFRRRQLIVSRDHVGKRSLYWTRKDGTLFFASEIKALLTIPQISANRAIHRQAIYPYLAYGLKDVDDTTFFDGVFSLPAGSWAVLDETFPGNIRHYWQIPARRLRERDISIGEAAERLRHTLLEACRIRTRADVPWSLALSGGMDSSALLAMLSALGRKGITTYTLRWPDPEWNEEPYARRVAQAFAADYRVIDTAVGDFWHDILPFTHLLEEPYHAPNVYANQFVRRLVRGEGKKVLWDGAGGDEILGGYHGYFAQAQLENLAHGRFRVLLDNAWNWTESDSRTKALTNPLFHIAQNAKTRLQITLGRPPKDWSIKAGFVRHANQALTLSRSLHLDMVSTKMPYWLRTADRNHAGIPIEMRRPLLDYRMVELAFSLPVSYLIRHGWHKWILRKALADILPAEVVWRRRKMGGPFPLQRFLAESQEVVGMIVRQANNPYVDPSLTGNAQRDWRLLSFLLWYELFFNRNVDLFAAISAKQPPTTRAGKGGFVPAYLATRQPWGAGSTLDT